MLRSREARDTLHLADQQLARRCCDRWRRRSIGTGNGRCGARCFRTLVRSNKSAVTKSES
jgi:hypothetical protein